MLHPMTDRYYVIAIQRQQTNYCIDMSTFILAAFLVSLITVSGCAAIAYLFPHNNSQD